MQTVAIEPRPAGERIPSATVEKIVRAIMETFSPVQIVVFGSYATGRATPESDLDLLVVTDPTCRGTGARRRCDCSFVRFPVPWTSWITG